MKTTVLIVSDELPQVYFITKDRDEGVECEVHHSTLKKWHRIWREFAEMQTEMKKALSEGLF